VRNCIFVLHKAFAAPGMIKKYAIIDVETTGGDPRKDKLTEIAIVVHDGQQVIDTFQSLVNPERSIPPFITQITGINDDMVRYAPKFYEIAREIIERTEDCYFVAHNARFDYGFITHEFRSLGYTYTKPTLCTVQLSRKAFPGFRSYSLGNLVKELQIPLVRHHRAMDDAMATTELFTRILERQHMHTDVLPKMDRNLARSMKLPDAISKAFLDSIPNTTGVYYLHGQQGHVLYVGKSIHLQQRIWEHFTDMSERGMKLQESVTDISWDETGSELASLLLENARIKELRPLYNKAQRSTHFPLRLVYDPESDNPLNIVRAQELDEKHICLQAFQDHRRAQAHLLAMLEKYGMGTEDTIPTAKTLGWPAIQQLIKHHLETNYTTLDSLFQEQVKPKSGCKIIADSGRHEEELFTVIAQQGVVTRYGYVDRQEWSPDIQVLTALLPETSPCPVADKIVFSKIKSDPRLRVIKADFQPTYNVNFF
jgi:DNA polymerase III subunit epsilon